MNDNKPIKAYKGFNKDLTCRGFQYEVGKEYEHKGTVSMCNSGFHACGNPMDVLSFYPPCDNNGTPRRYCEVEQSGTLDRSEDDKVCSSRIRVIAEIGLDGLIKAGVKFIMDKVNRKDDKESNTGDYSAATVEGKDSIAIVTGRDSKAKGSLGCWIVLTERDSDWHILNVKAAVVDGVRIKPDTWYQLVDGEFKDCN